MENSNKMILRQVQENFVPRNELFDFFCTCITSHLASTCNLIIEKLSLRSKYNHETETLEFKYLVAQQTIEQLRQELKQKEDILNLRKQNSGGIFNSLVMCKKSLRAPSQMAFLRWPI